MPYEPVEQPYQIDFEDIEPGMRVSFLDGSGVTGYDFISLDWENETALVRFVRPSDGVTGPIKSFPLDRPDRDDTKPWVLALDTEVYEQLSPEVANYLNQIWPEVNTVINNITVADPTTLFGSDPEEERLSWNQSALELAGDFGRTVQFTYQKASGPGGVMETRRLVPDENPVFSTRAANLAVTGHDIDRNDQRAFRLDRIVGYVTVLGN